MRESCQYVLIVKYALLTALARKIIHDSDDDTSFYN